MPKRSNDFQHLIKVIHDAFAGVDGASVTESAMVPEPDGTLREIDILLERVVGDVLIRIAVECRDRSRKSDVDWIDGLVGKYQNLKIDRIVAVCRRGFSAAAATKARANNIELRVLEDCLKTEWSSEFIRLGLAAFEFMPRFKSVELTVSPPPSEPIDPSSPVEIPALSAASQPLRAVILACMNESAIPKVKAYVEQEFLAKAPPLADLNQSWGFTVPVPLRDVWLVTSGGLRHRIVAMLFEITAEGRATVSAVQHFRYGPAAVASVGDLRFGEEDHKISVVQVAGHRRLTVSVTKPAKR